MVEEEAWRRVLLIATNISFSYDFFKIIENGRRNFALIHTRKKV